MTWQPNPTEVENLKKLLAGATTGDTRVQSQISNQLEAYSKIPEYNNYLTYLFATPGGGSPQEEAIRSVAGLSLKNNLKPNWSVLDPSIINYCKLGVLQALSDNNEMVRKVAGSIITTCVTGGLIERWPEVLPKLLELLERPDTIMGAFGALEKICEDSSMELDEKDVNFVGILIQKLLVHIDNPDANIRASVLCCTNQFLMIRSEAIWSHFDAYMNILYKCTSDPSGKVKRFVCQAFNNVVELNPDVLVPVLDSVISFMLHVMQGPDKEPALEAADFFLIFSEQDQLHIHIQPFLPRILPILLKCMVYTEDDIFILEAAAENNANIADQQQDIQPRFLKAKVHEAAGEKDAKRNGSNATIDGAEDAEDEDEEDEEDLDDLADEWNLRKCSAAALDMLSTVFQDDLLPDLLPTVNSMLNAPDWPIKEAGILALGAIASGSSKGMEPHLGQLLPHLIALLSHEKPLVRSITSWTLGRYSSWIVAPPEQIRSNPNLYEAHMSGIFYPFLQGILHMCLDKNKEVQKSGCSTLATIEEEAGDEIAPYLVPILDTITRCFQLYQRKNMLILFDAISTLAESVGPALNHPEYIQRLIPPIITKWNSYPDEDYDLFPLLECLASLSISIGPGFAPFAGPIWKRSISIIKKTIIGTQNNNADSSLLIPDKDLIIVSLDLISGIVQGLGPQAELLILDTSDESLFSILKYTMRDETADVRSSSFALLGDLCSSCFHTTLPHLNDIMTLIVANINVEEMDSQNTSAMNNAAWSAGEISIRHLANMEPFVLTLLSKLIPVLVHINTPRSLKENSAITIGRLGLGCPQLVAPHLGQFILKWCESLRLVHDHAEKASAFHGICKIIILNPEALLPFFPAYCDAVLKWNVAYQPELKQTFLGVFTLFRNALGDKWTSTIATIHPVLQAKMREIYGF